MASSDPARPVRFAEYLQAKFPLDERSLNPQVRDLLVGQLRGRPELRCLDLGTGSGAMLRRVLTWGLADRLVLAGLDAQSELLEVARQSLNEILRERGFLQAGEGNAWRIQQGGQSVALELHASSLADFHSKPGGYDLVTAQAFLDIVPLEEALRQVKAWLKDQGLFYTTLHYDGVTHLFPPYHQAAFEVRLLATYDHSMDRRTVAGKSTGGSRTGTRLHAALLAAGFEMLGYGSSDWNMTPESGAYRDQDRVCLRAMLEWIRKEGIESGAYGSREVEDWFRERNEQIHSGTLGIIVHQLDLLARKA